MTVSSLNNRWSFVGDGVTTNFPYDNLVFAPTDLKVYVAGVLQSSGYSVTGVLVPTGGNVVFSSAPANDDDVVIVRQVPFAQPIDLLDTGPFPAARTEDGLDRSVVLIQQLADQVNRSLRQPESDVDSIGALPGADARKGLFLYFDATTGEPTVAGLLDGTTLVSVAMAPVIAAANVTAARILLGADFGVTVTSFGADKTGVSDSTAAFQAAVDSGAGIVFVPRGNYKLVGTVTISQNGQKIIGAGGDHTFAAAGGSNIGFGDGSNDFFVVNAHDVTLENLNFHGDGGGNRAATGARAIVVGKDCVTLTGALAINNGATALVGTGTNFTANDIGKRIVIAGAGAAGEPLVTTITARADATHVTVNDAAGATVSGANGSYGTVYLGTRLTDVCSNSFHDAGVHFVTAAHFVMRGCAIKGKNAAVRVENRVGPDYGDSMISDCTFYSDTSVGKCVEWLSSGGLKVVNSKFLDGAYHIHMSWSLGLSGNFNVVNNSFENYTVKSIYMTGVGRSFTRANIVGNTFGGGGTAIEVAGSASWLKVLNISANTISMGTAVPAIVIDRTDVFEIKGNTIDGNSLATFGVTVASNASNGLIGRNNMANLATGDTSVSSATTAKEYETGAFTPALTFATPGNLSVTYSAQVGRYVKRGRKVSVQISIALSAFTHTTASGNLIITGLPYAAANVTNNHAIGAMSFSGVTKASYTQFSPYVAPTDTTLLVLASGSGQVLSTITAADMPSGGTVALRLTVEYETTT